MGDTYSNSAAIQSGLNSLSQSIDSVTMMQSGKNAQKRAQKYNIEMQDRAQAINLENWNRQNEYSSPENSMKLYKEAGLNPNLIYGQGQVEQGNLAKYQAPQTDTGKPPSYKAPEGVLGQHLQFNALRAQTDNVRAQEKTQTQMAKNAVWDGLNKQLDARSKGLMIPIDIQRANADIKRLDATTGNIGEQKAGQIIKNKMAQEELDYMQKHGRKMPSTVYESVLQDVVTKAKKLIELPKIKTRKGKDVWGNPIKP